jgi:hypothetical protein
MTDKIRLFPKSARAVVLGLAAVSLTALATPAYAGGKGYYGGGGYYSGGYYAGGGRYYDRGHHGGGYGGNRYYRGRGGISGGEAALIGLGIIGGAILIDRALDDRRYDDRRYDDRRYDDRYDRRAGAADDDYYYYQRDARPYEDDNRVRSARDDGDASEADLLGAGSAGSVAVNAAFRECVAETRGAAGAGGLQVAMPGVPTEVETLADGSVRMTAQFRATNGRGQDFTRRFVCEADDRGVRFLQVD